MTTTRALIDIEALMTRCASQSDLLFTIARAGDRATESTLHDTSDLLDEAADCLRAILPSDAPSPDRERVARVIEPAMGAVVKAALDPAMTHVRMGVIADEARDKAVAAILALTAADPIPIERETVEDAHERALGEVIDQREAAEEALSQAYYLVTGRYPQWSNLLRYSEALNEIREALSAAPVLSEPQRRPIASAPKDGTWFVALENGMTYPCEWVEEEADEGPPRAGWFDHFNKSFENPDHWLPAPPAKLSGVGE